MNKNKIFFTVLAVLIFLGYFFWITFFDPTPQTNPGFVEYKQLNLDDRTQNILETKLQDQIGLLENKDLSEMEKKQSYVTIASLYGDLGYYRKSKDYFDMALELKPDDHVVWSMYSNMLSAAEDHLGAKQAIDKALSIAPASYEYWKWKIQLEQEKLKTPNDQIDQYYLKALEKTNNHLDIMVLYAQFLEQAGFIPRAIEYYNKAIEINPERKAMYQEEIDRINTSL